MSEPEVQELTAFLAKYGDPQHGDPVQPVRQRVLGPGVKVGDYITTDKPSDVWWKVLAVTEDRPGKPGNTIRFRVVNHHGYERELNDPPGAGRRFYRWLPDDTEGPRDRRPSSSSPPTPTARAAIEPAPNRQPAN